MNHFGYTSGSGREGRQPEVKVGRSAHNAMTLWWVPLRKGVLIQLYNVVVVQILSVIRLARCSHKAVPVRLCLRYHGTVQVDSTHSSTVELLYQIL